MKKKRVGFESPLLTFAKGYKELVLYGNKRITIRLGIKYYCPGQVLATNLGFNIKLIEVRYYKIFSIPLDVLRMDGFSTRSELIKGLSEFYPSINVHSTVTVLKFEPVLNGYNKLE